MMMPEVYQKKLVHPLDVDATAACIAKVQRSNGDIPWHASGKTDPWDMVEAAMGLSIGGYESEAEKAYEWLACHQNSDGSWFTAYQDGCPTDTTRDANLSAYIAVGVFHHYLFGSDYSFLRQMWGCVQSAIDFALGLQAPHGEIFWAISPDGVVDRMALLTGSSSVYLSIRCALAAARVLGYRHHSWEMGLDRLQHAVVSQPHRFNMTKARYAMDWYYPVLCGAMTGAQSVKRIDHLWKKFVIESRGVRCVSDQPWITIAESSELSLTLSAAGRRTPAEIVFNWIVDKKYEDGWYWAGFTSPDMTVWPGEKLTWTNAAVLLAADALYDLTPASRLFSHAFWSQEGQ